VTDYNWKRKYGAIDIGEARRLRALEEENGRLKRLVAELSIQNQILKSKIKEVN
jgi:putative transposase